MSGAAAASIRQFDADLDKFAKLLGINTEMVVRRLAIDALQRVVRKTPVDTGRARAGWSLQEGSPSNHLPGEGRHTGHGPVGQISGTAPVYIVNNVEYILPLEAGHSQQAPGGMVVLTVAEMQAEIAAIIASATK